MALHIELNQDELWNFFALYDQLGQLQQKIWQRIVWYCTRYPNAHPTQEKIAKGIPCSRKHVNRTLALFQQHGWLHLSSRGPRRAKCLIVLHQFLVIDVSRRQYSRKVEVTSKVTHSDSIEIRTSRVTGTINFSKKGERQVKLDIPLWLEKKPFSHENKLKLSLCSHEAYSQAYSETGDRLNCGWKIGNMEDYLVESTIKIAQKRGEKLNWRSFYIAKEEYGDRELSRTIP